MNEEKNYSDYPFPVGMLIATVILSVVCIVGNYFLTKLAVYLWQFGWILRLLSYPVCFILAAAIPYGCAVSIVPDEKVYRVGGYRRILSFITFVSAAVFILMSVIFIRSLTQERMEISVFGLIMTALQILSPGILTFSESIEIKSIKRYCASCKLMNTMTFIGEDVEDRGTHSKFHNEGGEYKDIKTSGRLCGDNYDSVSFTTRQYIPKTMVYDGLYKHEHKTQHYRCSHCNCIWDTESDTETRVG